MTPTAEAFRALSRSSPWRWRTLHFEHRGDSEGGDVEAWVRRPGRLEVQVIGGTAVHSVEERPDRPWPPPEPQWRSDGLVARRPDLGLTDLDDAMWQHYRWIAMLDPAELSHHVDIDDVREDTIHGRPVWRADLRPVLSYEPRCGGGCCELLISEAGWLSDDLEDPSRARPVPADLLFPDHHDVALDLETGIVVRYEAVGGRLRYERSIDNRILEVG